MSGVNLPHDHGQNIEKVLENKVSFGRMFYMKYVKQGQSNLLMISVIINL